MEDSFDVPVSSIQLPDALKPYQEAIDLIWTDNMQESDIDQTISKLEEFVTKNILSKSFIKMMLLAALDANIKNSYNVLLIAKKMFSKSSIFSYYHNEQPNPIFWNDDVDTLTTQDLSPNDIKTAALYGAVKCFKVLIGKFSSFSEDLCESAIIGGNLEIIRILDHHLHFATEENALIAIQNHRNNILDLILEKDPSLFKTNKNSIYCLRFMNYQSLIWKFKKSKLNCRNSDFCKLNLIKSYSKEFFKALFDLGLNVDFIYKDMYDRYTLLIESAKKNNAEYVKFLVEQGADVNLILCLCLGSTTTENYTALRFAVLNDNVELAEYLLKHGANPNISYTSSGCFHYCTMTLYDSATSQEMINLLNSYKKTD